ncbi:uncharacterized protein LOC129190833 isoform X2 [Dunckerocampus dactyliophorus]|uniref:uncharacterized protein LOC129190833 isoform X2 n=1 Tax=Dunckerocampus dactyliophorus TaxID=161453 RepID=UPI002405BBFF|nr:uncharacterized protein LOC129190833 isoform X2 [Dunckerocampus dactyliophorus]
MLTCWLTFTAFLAVPAYPEGAAVGQNALTVVVPTIRVEGQPQVAVTIKCGDGKGAGVVAYWHTPFGHLQTPGFHSRLDPVYMHHDGRLVVNNLSSLHEGLYYCLLQHDGVSTLFPYQLRKRPEDGGREHLRVRRELGSVPEEQKGVSVQFFAGAVAASVLLTFVFGFSAGALSRRHVLRCLPGLTRMLPASSPRQQHHLPGSDITMVTLPPMYNKMEQVRDDETTSSLGSNPPAKPQRSFRERRGEDEQEATAYLEACDQVEGRSKEEARGRLEECEGKVTEVRPSGDDSSKEDEEGRRQEDDADEVGEVGGSDGRMEEKKRNDENEGEKRDDEDGVDMSSEDLSSQTDDDDGDKGKKDEPSSCQVSPPRPSRVIRLYQYDEDGRRYGHLPDEPSPAPRLKQRSASLTRLNTIMASASAGQMDTPPGEEEAVGKTERAHFSMNI